MVADDTRQSFRLTLFLCTAVVLGSYKLIALGAGRLDQALLSGAVEACAWAWLWALSEGLTRLSWARKLRLPGLVFYPLLYMLAGFSFAHTFFFDSAAERRFSLLDIDAGAVLFFFRDVLPPQGWAVLLGLLAAIHAGAWWLRRVSFRLSMHAWLGAIAALSLLVAVGSVQATRVASPVVDIGRDFWELLATPTIVSDRYTRSRHGVRALDKSAQGPSQLDTPYKKVLVFVMETMTSDKLEAERAALSPSTFIQRERPRFHAYSRYFPTNQDSRTGMLGMLSSRFIPYEAYTDQGRDHYMFLGAQPSLVDRMNALGYESAFAVSQTDLELVVSDMHWKHTLHLTEESSRAAAKKHLCFVPYEFEHSCEDLALLPAVLDFIDGHERVFLYQEFIWGHASEYNAASGKTNAEYYSAYLDAVVAHLEEKRLLDETLIVLTSDHGFRDKALQRELTVYQIPLLFFAGGFSPKDDPRLFSHADFKDLLLSELSLGSVQVADNPFVMITGPTGTSMTAVLTRDHDFMLWKTRGATRYLLHHANLREPGRPPAALESPAAFSKLFDDYQRYFDGLAKTPH